MNTKPVVGNRARPGARKRPVRGDGSPPVGLVPPRQANAALGCPIYGSETDRRLLGRRRPRPDTSSRLRIPISPHPEDRCKLLEAEADVGSSSTKGRPRTLGNPRLTKLHPNPVDRPEPIEGSSDSEGRAKKTPCAGPEGACCKSRESQTRKTARPACGTTLRVRRSGWASGTSRRW